MVSVWYNKSYLSFAAGLGDIMDREVTFGAWLRRRRRLLDFTQKELARQVGCAVVTIRKFEADERKPSKDLAERLAVCLKLFPEEVDQFIAFARTEPYLSPQPSAPTPLSSLTTVTPLFLKQGEKLSETEEHVFVAREQELAQLNAFLEAALAGQGRVVFITGEAGSGKTALVEEFVRQACRQQAGLIVAGGNCNAYGGPGDPYLPFREILALLTGDVEARYAAGTMSQAEARHLWEMMPHAVGALVEAAPDLIDTFIPGRALAARAANAAALGADWPAELRALLAEKESAQSLTNLQQSDLFAQYARLLQRLAQIQPLLLVLDDLQWADSGSISLLFHLGRQVQGHPILIVGIYRPADVALGRAGERHPLEPVINEFQRYFGGNRVDLSRSGGQHFVEAFLDSEPNRLGDDFRRMLYRVTKGHALFTVEMLRGMQARGDLVQDDTGYWVEGTTLNWESLPARVEGVIAERLNRLPAALREILNVAAVEGETFTAEVIVQVQGVETRSLVRQLSRDLDKQHRLVRGQGSQMMGSGGPRLSRYRFRHILFQRYLYSHLDQVARAHLHQDVGNVLEQVYGQQTAEIAVRLARHFQEAGLVEKAIGYRQEAGDAAARMFADGEAAKHFSCALELATEYEISLDERLHLYHRLGRALEMDSQFAKALAIYEMMQKAAAEDRNQAVELTAQVGKANIYASSNSEHNLPLAQKLSEQALDLARKLGDQTTEIQILLNLLNICRYSNRLLQAIVHGEAALTLARQLDLADQAATALSELCRCYGLNGHLPRGLALSREAISLWRTLDNLPMVCDSLAVAHIMGAFIGAYDQALVDSEEAFQISQIINNIWHQSYSRTLAGYIYRERGQPDQAIEVMVDSIRLGESVDFLFPQVVTRANLAAVYSDLGAVEQGLEVVRQALRIAETHLPVYRAYVLAALAQIHLSGGSLTEAESVIAQAKKDPNREAIPMFAPFISIAEGELMQAQGHYEHALSLSDTILTTLHQAGIQAPLPHVLFLQSQALLALGRVTTARERLQEARTVAEEMVNRRQLWPILIALSHLEGDSAEVERLHQQTRGIVNYIFDHTPPDLRASFLALSDVQAIGLP